jgi:hypothetical protein
MVGALHKFLISGVLIGVALFRGFFPADFAIGVVAVAS